MSHHLGLTAGVSDGAREILEGMAGGDAGRVGWPSRSLVAVLETHAVQVPRQPSPQVSQGEISSDELARVRCCSGAAGKPTLWFTE
jgi:hypothetical protein